MYCCVTGSENEMKKLFTADDFMVAFISALGYGFGETIARISGWSELMCIAASFAVGIVLEEIIGGIVFSKAIRLILMICWFIVMRFFGKGKIFWLSGSGIFVTFW